MADDAQVEQVQDDLAGVVSNAHTTYLQHAQDADSNAYLAKYQTLSNALDAVNEDAFAAAVDGLQADADAIGDATKRLSTALSAITSAEDAFAQFSAIVDNGVTLLTALQSGNVQAVKNALDGIRTTFVGAGA